MKNWITTKIKLDVNKNEINRFLFKSYTVDSDGKILNETEYDLASAIIYKRIYNYFEDGALNEYIEYDPFDTLLERHTFIKNQTGEIDTHEIEFSDGQKSIKKFSFTDLGNADKATITDENGEITGFEVYIFDELGRIKEEIELDSENNELSKYIKTYNENDTLKLEKYYRDEVLISSELFEYDAFENVIKKIHRNYADKFEVIDKYQFDENNNMIYNSSRQNGVLIFENKCSYDEQNNLITEEFFELNYWEKRIVRHEKLIHETKKNDA